MLLSYDTTERIICQLLREAARVERAEDIETAGGVRHAARFLADKAGWTPEQFQELMAEFTESKAD
jgi:hypothetical protein